LIVTTARKKGKINLAKASFSALIRRCEIRQQARLDRSPPLGRPDVIGDVLGECRFDGITWPDVSGYSLVKRFISGLILAPGKRQTCCSSGRPSSRLGTQASFGHG
jgi:hypothetical protein